MKLEFEILNIKDIKFAEKTAIADGVLFVDYPELQGLLEKDQRLSKVDIELAHPGESCRIVQVFDVIEPRCKINETGENFPGALGSMRIAGEGRTRALRGMAVVTVEYGSGPHGMVIDMSGPGADIGPYAKLQNIVLLCHPADGISQPEYENAVRMAGLKAAVYMAEAGRQVQADETKVYELPSLNKAGKGMEQLPRVAYVYQIHSLQQGAAPNEPIFYGDNTNKLLPTIVHPNEILDGAIVRGYYCQGQETYTIQNHPIIQELYENHGKTLCFAGVVVTVAHYTEPGRERNAAIAANLVKSVLGADGAILTKIGGGAPHIDLAQTCELCEKNGVKTTIIVTDMSSDNTSEGALLFNTPQADAVVNVGSFGRQVKLPAVKRVIGGPFIFPGNRAPEGEIGLTIHMLAGAVDELGGSRLISAEF